MKKEFKKGNQLLMAAVFFGSIITILCFYYLVYGRVYLESPDGNLYLSVSDNLLQNGRFIQNHYKDAPDFVVPFGLPLILLLLKLAVNRTWFIVAFQYFLFGLTNLFLFKTCKKLFQSNLGGVFSCAFYLCGIMLNRVCGPAYVLTENYTLFILVGVCYVLASESLKEGTKVFVVDILLFVGWTIRPVLAVCFFPGLIYTGILVLKERRLWKKACIMLGTFVAVMAVNLLVNHREVGEWVLLENYGAYDVYLANNENTKTYPFGSDLYPEFLDDYGLAIKNSGLPRSQKARLYNARTREFIAAHLPFVLKNMAVKYWHMFVRPWWPCWVSTCVAFGLCACLQKERRKCFLAYAGMFFALSVTTAFGLNIDRYGIVALPYMAIMNAGYVGLAARKLKSTSGGRP